MSNKFGETARSSWQLAKSCLVVDKHLPTPPLEWICYVECQERGKTLAASNSTLGNSLKPGSTGLASRRKSIASFRPAFCLTTYLHWLAMTCVDLRWLWSSSNSCTSRRKFYTVWSPNASRHKSKLFATCVNLWADLRIRLATHHKPCANSGFPKLGRCIDLRVLDPFVQDLPNIGSSNQVPLYVNK